MRKNPEIELAFCQKRLREHIAAKQYREAMELIQLHPNEREAQNVFLKQCRAVMEPHFSNGKQRSDMFVDLIGGVKENAPEEWRDFLHQGLMNIHTNLVKNGSKISFTK